MFSEKQKLLETVKEIQQQLARVVKQDTLSFDETWHRRRNQMCAMSEFKKISKDPKNYSLIDQEILSVVYKYERIHGIGPIAMEYLLEASTTFSEQIKDKSLLEESGFIDFLISFFEYYNYNGDFEYDSNMKKSYEILVNCGVTAESLILQQRALLTDSYYAKRTTAMIVLANLKKTIDRFGEIFSPEAHSLLLIDNLNDEVIHSLAVFCCSEHHDFWSSLYPCETKRLSMVEKVVAKDLKSEAVKSLSILFCFHDYHNFIVNEKIALLLLDLSLNSPEKYVGVLSAKLLASMLLADESYINYISESNVEDMIGLLTFNNFYIQKSMVTILAKLSSLDGERIDLLKDSPVLVSHLIAILESSQFLDEERKPATERDVVDCKMDCIALLRRINIQEERQLLLVSDGQLVRLINLRDIKCNKDILSSINTLLCELFVSRSGRVLDQLMVGYLNHDDNAIVSLMLAIVDQLLSQSMNGRIDFSTDQKEAILLALFAMLNVNKAAFVVAKVPRLLLKIVESSPDFSFPIRDNDVVNLCNIATTDACSSRLMMQLSRSAENKEKMGRQLFEIYLGEEALSARSEMDGDKVFTLFGSGKLFVPNSEVVACKQSCVGLLSELTGNKVASLLTLMVAELPSSTSVERKLWLEAIDASNTAAVALFLGLLESDNGLSVVYALNVFWLILSHEISEGNVTDFIANTPALVEKLLCLLENHDVKLIPCALCLLQTLLVNDVQVSAAINATNVESLLKLLFVEEEAVCGYAKSMLFHLLPHVESKFNVEEALFNAFFAATVNSSSETEKDTFSAQFPCLLFSQSGVASGASQSSTLGLH